MEHHDDPVMHGRWEPVQYRFNFLPVHIALLHTGKVLAFGGSGNDETRLHTPYQSEIWDPETGQTRIIDQDLPGDIFCAGHSMLADGRVLAAGGTLGYDNKVFGIIPLPPFTGMNHTYLFDPVSERWERVQDMPHGRWYPTVITLGDGTALAAAGFTERFPWVFLRAIDIYTPGQGWQKLQGADRWLPLYPRLHLLPDGTIFYAGSYNTHYTYPFRLTRFPTGVFDMLTRKWSNLGLPTQSEREEGASILLPLTPPDYRPRVLLVGGGTTNGDDAINDAEIIDLGEDKPIWRHIAPMKHARYYNYGVILPNRQILIVGGRSGKKGHVHDPMPDDPGHPHPHVISEVPADKNAIHEAELFDPDSETWTTMAEMTVDRLYHSNAMLLPDGRVMTAGSNPERRVNELRIEIYSPPYLFMGERPIIDNAPAEVTYGATFEIETTAADMIDEIALIRLSATTHCLNTDQRYVGLEITGRLPGKITTQMPGSRNIAPPGYYMLFILHEGVPSVAKFVRVH